MIYDDFRVTGAHDTALDHADLLSLSIFVTKSVQEFDAKWDEVSTISVKDSTNYQKMKTVVGEEEKIRNFDYE